MEVARGILTRVHNSGEQADEDEEAQERAEARNPDQASDEEGSSPRARTYAPASAVSASEKDYSTIFSCFVERSLEWT